MSRARLVILTSFFVALLALSISLVYLPRTPPVAPSQLRIGVLKHESSLPIYVADELGLFSKHDIGVTLIEVPPGDHMPALLSNRVDVLSPTSFPVLFGVMSQHPHLLFSVFPGAEILSGPTIYGFVVSPDFPGSTIADLRDAVVIAINPFTKLNIETIFSSAAIPRSRWPEIRVANREAALTAVANRTALAAIMDQPALALALSTGEYHLLEPNPRARYISNPYWSGAGAVKRSTWRKKREDLLSLMRAIDEALTNIAKDPNAANAILASRLGLDPAIAKNMGGYYFPRSTEIVPLDGIEKTISALTSAGLLSRPVSTSQFFPPGSYGQ